LVPQTGGGAAAAFTVVLTTARASSAMPGPEGDEVPPPQAATKHPSKGKMNRRVLCIFSNSRPRITDHVPWRIRIISIADRRARGFQQAAARFKI
jgi:hypothetical protein